MHRQCQNNLKGIRHVCISSDARVVPTSSTCVVRLSETSETCLAQQLRARSDNLYSPARLISPPQPTHPSCRWRVNLAHWAFKITEINLKRDLSFGHCLNLPASIVSSSLAKSYLTVTQTLLRFQLQILASNSFPSVRYHKFLPPCSSLLNSLNHLEFLMKF